MERTAAAAAPRGPGNGAGEQHLVAENVAVAAEQNPVVGDAGGVAA